MGGSGGGGSYFSARDVEVLREGARRRLEQSRIDAEVNSLLQQELASVNDRDADKINRYIDEIEAALQGRIRALDRLIFDGSVAKHTYVDGLSDIDSLVILNDESLAGKSPAEVRDQFRETLVRYLPQRDIQDMKVGRMAVTIKYRDGTEIQLLPAVQSDGEISISSADGNSWIRIRPRLFAQELTVVNKRQGGAVVPAIKLAKAILANKLGDRSPSGYHVENLAVAAFRDYSGPRTPKEMLVRLFERASDDVCRPIRDVTGQSPHVDESLGPPDSLRRRELCRAFQDLSKMMSGSRSISDWRSLFE